MPHPHPTGWFKASYSDNANACVEIRFDEAITRVRDSKNPAGGHFAVGAGGWAGFVDAMKQGVLDH